MLKAFDSGPRAAAALCCALPALLVLLAFALWHSSGASGPSPGDYSDLLVLVHASGTDPSQEASIAASRLPAAGGPSNDGHLPVFGNAAPHFHVEGACGSVARTSATASAAGCRYAVNGGPFQSYFSGGCVGPVVSHARALSGDWNTSYISFGLTSAGDWILGRISSEVAARYGVVEAVTGFGWLLRDGRVVTPRAEARAQRTAIGVDGLGRLYLLQVDGCERCPFTGGPSGPTLPETAQLLARAGATHAISLDGGGSSTTYAHGEVVNRPDCLELGFRCERSVTTVACVT